MPLYHLVGALDPLTDADIAERLNDGLPETLPEWIVADGLTHLKIKLNGDDLDWDVQRVLSIEKIVAETQADRGVSEWYYSADFNETCQDVEYLLGFLHKIQEGEGHAFERLAYIEQPTDRNLKAHPENKMHHAAKIKPVVIDESLTDFETFQLAREQGYSGVALKACKGQSQALLMGAAAIEYDMFLAVQDLTCPGASFLHSAGLAARVPRVTAIEGNARQFCPVANEAWKDRFPSIFNITDGTIGTHVLTGNGLGH
jgi:L-alanine-DL-glutamate epimerase-like enolase superfamily enzyme